MGRKLKLMPVGTRIGKWIVSGDPIRLREGKATKYPCRCACGTLRDVYSTELLAGRSKSCGCAVRVKTVGRTNAYRSWASMWERCTDPKHPSWDYYGGKGITICKQWESFACFLHDMGERPAGMSLDRINSNGHYEPSNCRWATSMEQGRNTKRVRLLTINGDTKRLSDWSIILNIPISTLHSRYCK